MARRKANLRTRPKSVTLERASSQNADEVGDQEMHEASTQASTQVSTLDVQPAKRVTRGPNKYLEIWDLPDDQEIELPLNSMHQPVDEGARTFTGFLGTIARKPHMCPIKYLDWKVMPEELKEECWRLVKRKYQVPDNPKAYEGLKKFTLQKIGKAWRDHKCRLKAKYYIPHSRNKARVKSNGPRKCIPEDWNILVDHWYSDDAVIESDKNKDRRSKQDDIHTGGSCGYAMHAAKNAKTDGHPVERAVLFQILHTRKDGSAVNPAMKEKMDKMKDLLVDPKNQLQSSDISGSIAWSRDDVFAKVMGKEHKGRIRGVGFGPTPSGQSSKTALTNSEIQLSQARDNEVAQLKASLATMEEKLVGFDEMKEKVSQFEEMEQRMEQRMEERMEQRMARMLQQMQQTTQCNQDAPLIEQSPALPKSSAASHQPGSL
ncbi:uncharacterized protein LOC115958567 isoform X3 [Quercus lobata]|uniref:uncharacterized protein LOC115958567 isoform X3 n=1 Tax=Quercus lobata TaxID=97700 RepID=UPI00124521B2|nr:uncharacterized protein LOC115958567 isoform X3 [Quercus lobata]